MDTVAIFTVADIMADKNRGTFIGGLAIGAAIGTVTGLLVAPRRGRETQKILKKTAAAVPQIAEDLSTSWQFQADRFAAAAGDRWQETIDRLGAAISAGIVASQSVRELETSDRTGDRRPDGVEN
jgi:gas vesicle protein